MNFFCQTPSFRSNSLKKKWIHLINIMLLLTLVLSAISCGGSSKTNNIASVRCISAGFDAPGCSNSGVLGHSAINGINVSLIPSSSALANTKYEVDLYEKGALRGTATISWNQPEINVHSARQVGFDLSVAEFAAYHGKDISAIFTVTVHE